MGLLFAPGTFEHRCSNGWELATDGTHVPPRALYCPLTLHACFTTEIESWPAVLLHETFTSG